MDFEQNSVASSMLCMPCYAFFVVHSVLAKSSQLFRFVRVSFAMAGLAGTQQQAAVATAATKLSPAIPLEGATSKKVHTPDSSPCHSPRPFWADLPVEDLLDPDPVPLGKLRAMRRRSAQLRAYQGALSSKAMAK